MLISVIVPIYKVEKYLPRCVDSIINQTYKDLEIILVPQPGGDECEDICRKYEKTDSRVVVCVQSMCDLSHARNVGIDHANGQYIAFIDSDDILDKQFIEDLFCLVREYHADIAQCCSYAFVDEKAISNKVDHNFVDEYSGKEMCYALSNNKYGSDSGVIQTKLYDIRLFRNIRFPEGRVNEDGATNYKLYWAANKVVVTGHKLYYYRSQREGSIIHTLSNRLYRDSIISSFERQQFFADTGEKLLYEYATYVFFNDVVRALSAIRDDVEYCNELKVMQKTLLQEIMQSSHLGMGRKCLTRLGYVSPKLWVAIWNWRNRWRYFVEWKVKGEKK